MAKKRIPLGRGLERRVDPRARRAQLIRRTEQMVAKDPAFRAGDQRRTLPARVQASQGFSDRRINPTRKPSGVPPRRVPQAASQAARGAAGVGRNIVNALRVSPVALGAAALLQPSQLGHSTRGTPMNTPAEVAAIRKKRRLRKARAIPRSMRRGLR